MLLNRLLRGQISSMHMSGDVSACFELRRLCWCVTKISLIPDLATTSERSENQIPVVIDVTGEVIPLLQRLYKGWRGDCHSGMASGVVRKLQPGNLMPLIPSYTHSIYPQDDLGMQGSTVVWGPHSYPR